MKEIMLSDKVKKAIAQVQTRYPERRSALLPALHLAQQEVGYLPLEVQKEVADLFGIELNEVHSVVTFYDMFHDEPVGKHVIHVCKNISCMLRGADGVLTGLCHKLQINPGGTTADGEFTVIASECLGACDRAPMMLVDDRVVGPVSERDLDSVLADAKKGHGHASPITIEEVLHG